MRIKLVAAATVFLSVVLSLALAEGLIRLAVNPADFLHATLIDDPILGHRIQPFATGHDALGYRNKEVPQRANIVAIGDSTTYGVSASREDSWPQQLAGLLGEPVYSMALGGYGPLQYLQLAQDAARRFSPRLILVGFYFGNDLMDANTLAHDRPHWFSWRISGRVEVATVSQAGVAPAEPIKRFGALRDWLARNSVLYAVLRATVFHSLARSEQVEQAKLSSPDVRWLWRDSSNASVRTIFTPHLRLAALDLDLPSVRDGMAITKRSFTALQEAANKQGSRLLVVLIPTKERAYCSYMAANGERLPDTFTKLCIAESSAKAELVRFLDSTGTLYVDAATALEGKIAAHMQCFPTDSDGHPLAAGYRVIAQEVAGAIRRLR